jgi:hypothetical protein
VTSTGAFCNVPLSITQGDLTTRKIIANDKASAKFGLSVTGVLSIGTMTGGTGSFARVVAQEGQFNTATVTGLLQARGGVTINVTLSVPNQTASMNSLTLTSSGQALSVPNGSTLLSSLRVVGPTGPLIAYGENASISSTGAVFNVPFTALRVDAAQAVASSSADFGGLTVSGQTTLGNASCQDVTAGGNVTLTNGTLAAKGPSSGGIVRVVLLANS